MKVREYINVIRNLCKSELREEGEVEFIIHIFIVKRPKPSYAILFLLPVCIINLSNGSSYNIKIIFIIILLIIAIISINKTIWFLRHKNDDVSIELEADSMKIDNKEYKMVNIKKIIICDNDLQIRIRRSLKLIHYKLEQKNKIEIINTLEQMTNGRGIIFKNI